MNQSHNDGYSCKKVLSNDHNLCLTIVVTIADVFLIAVNVNNNCDCWSRVITIITAIDSMEMQIHLSLKKDL